MAEPLEGYATGFSFRAIDKNWRIVRKEGSPGGLYVYGEEDSLSMAVLLSDTGSVLPVLSGPYADGGVEALTVLSKLRNNSHVRVYKPSACLGASAHVSALELAMEWTPALDVDYDAMQLIPEINAKPLDPPPLGIATYRPATASDLDSLYPLAAAYEKSEVMTPIHVFDPSACRNSQARSLSMHLVYVAIVRGRIVARAQTNARGWSTDQIGGVYVEPEYRGLGLGRGVVCALISDIASSNRRISLFVKKSNVVAQSLYKNIGFSRVTDYRVSYF